MAKYKVKKEILKNGKTVFRVRTYKDDFSWNDISEADVMWKGFSKTEAYEQRDFFQNHY